MKLRWAGLTLITLLFAPIIFGRTFGMTVLGDARTTTEVAASIQSARLLRVAPAGTPGGEYPTIQSALAAAQDGDVIEVSPGIYTGPLVIDKSVHVSGIDRPVIDGGGQGTVVSLAAPGITFEGFEIINSGIEPDRDHAGITLTASGITIQDNLIREVLFGIFLAQADKSVVRNNDISSKSEYGLARKGDGIRVWYSQNVVVEGNHVHDARDVVVWYSSGSRIKGNTIENGRYGIHLMYADGAQIESNRVIDNSVGIYTMYSKSVKLFENLVRGQHGSSGYALGFKDSEGVEASRNLLVDNRSAIFTDGTPFSPGSQAIFSDNVLAYNDIGVTLLTSTRGARFLDNTFWENYEQVAIQGSGHIGENLWQGNYWSDYAGFDVDSDGRGEIAYQSDRFFEGLTDREPLLRVLAYSPAAQAVEFAATSFPLVKPQPKFIDSLPSTSPSSLSDLDLDSGQASRYGSLSLAVVGAILLAACAAGWLALRREAY